MKKPLLITELQLQEIKAKANEAFKYDDQRQPGDQVNRDLFLLAGFKMWLNSKGLITSGWEVKTLGK